MLFHLSSLFIYLYPSLLILQTTFILTLFHSLSSSSFLCPALLCYSCHYPSFPSLPLFYNLSLPFPFPTLTFITSPSLFFPLPSLSLPLPPLFFSSPHFHYLSIPFPPPPLTFMTSPSPSLLLPSLSLSHPPLSFHPQGYEERNYPPSRWICHGRMLTRPSMSKMQKSFFPLFFYISGNNEEGENTCILPVSVFYL